MQVKTKDSYFKTLNVHLAAVILHTNGNNDVAVKGKKTIIIKKLFHRKMSVQGL